MPANNIRNKPIGVFDSGLGGLTVVKEMKKYLPFEDIIYFGDTARVPYGTKSREAIIRFSKQNVSLLLGYNVKMVVIACNSSSSHALNILKKTFSVPIMGVIEPGVKKAVDVTCNKRIGVIATPATIKSGAYKSKIQKLKSSIKVFNQACPLFVPIVEENWQNKQVAVDVARDYLSPLKQAHVDTLILGCTHYPLLKNVLRKVMGPKVELIDSAKEVVLNVKAHLDRNNIACIKKRASHYVFLSSDAPNHFRQSAVKFLGFSIEKVRRLNI